MILLGLDHMDQMSILRYFWGPVDQGEVLSSTSLLMEKET